MFVVWVVVVVVGVRVVNTQATNTHNHLVCVQSGSGADSMDDVEDVEATDEGSGEEKDVEVACVHIGVLLLSS